MAQQKNSGGDDWQRRQESGGVAEQEPARASVGGVLGAAAGAARGAASGVASGVASAAGQAWEATSRGATTAARTAEDAFLSVRGCMARYPFATFFAGVGVGALLAMTLWRRK